MFYLLIVRLRNLLRQRCRFACGLLWLLLMSLLLPAGTVSAADTGLPVSDSSLARPEPELTRVRIQLPWLHQFEFAGFYAAIEQGFYRRRGLDVELVESHAGVSVLDEVISGRAQYGLSNGELLIARAEGQPILLLANIFKHSPLVILARKDSEIRRPRDLIGKRLMTSPADLNSAEIRFMLDREQMSRQQLSLMAHSYRIDELLSNQVDAMTAYITNQPYQLQEAGIEPSIIDPANYGADFYSNTLFTLEQELEQHPQRVAALHQATLEGWQYALAHPKEIVELIYNRYSPRKSIAALHYEAREVSKLIAADVYPLGSIDPERLQRLQEIYLRTGAQSQPVELNRMIWPRASVNSSDNNIVLNLSPQQLQRLADVGTARVCAYPGWLPYEGIRNAEHQGINVDLLRHVAQGVGLGLTSVAFESWGEAYQGLLNGRCDLLSGITPSAERRARMIFSDAYLSITNAVVTRKDQPFVADLQELEGRTLGVIGGSIQEAQLVQHFPGIRLQSFNRLETGLTALSVGKLDGFVDAVAASGYYIRHLGLENLQIAGLFPYKNELSFAVRKDWPQIAHLLNQSLAAIPEYKRHRILQHWIKLSSQPATDFTLIWQIALAVLLLVILFALFYSRLRQANRDLAREVEQRRAAEASIRQVNEALLDANQQLETLSRTDILTGLRNRYCIETELESAMLNCSANRLPFSLLLLDMDHFKSVNDRFGHGVGDQVLTELAQILAACQKEGVKAGRWGGEEFMLLLPGQALEQARSFAQMVRQAVADTAFTQAGALTVSIGLAQLEMGDSQAQLVNRADQALYRAKAEGRNCVRSSAEAAPDQNPAQARASFTGF